MKKRERSVSFGLFRSKKNFIVLIVVLSTTLAFAFTYGVMAPRRYPIRTGERSRWDINAPFDMEDRVQTERYADEAAKAAPKVYKRDPELSAKITERCDAFIGMIARAHNAYRDAVMQNGVTFTGADMQNLRDESVTRLCEQAINFKVSISREEAGSIITEISRAELDAFFGDFSAKIKDLAENTDITSDNYNDHVAALRRSIQQTMYANQNLKNVTSLYADSALSVNATIDEERTRQAQDRVREINLERKIIIPKGKRIINVDDYVTPSQYQLLHSYNLIEDGGFNAEHLVKMLFILFGISVLFSSYLRKAAAEILESNSQALQIGCIVVFVLALCRALYPIHRFAMPVFIAPILIGYLVDYRVSLVVNILVLSAVSLFTGMDVNTMLFFFIGASLAAIMMSSASTRARFIIIAFSLGATCALLYIALTKSIMDPSEYAFDAVILFVASVSSTFLSMGLIALMESLFNTATPLRLTELSSGGTPLLRRLSFEAPGTNHHCLMVGYMAEAAAIEIGANPFITKAGAYYHDAGKLIAPGYFSENQNGQNPHDLIDPQESCRIIVSHTQEGVILCQKSKLPQRVIDIVREHHGDTMVAYFYNKAVMKRGESNVRREEYRYPGPRPSSRESALVMMADSCEAAVRSLENKDEAQIVECVRKTIRVKIEDEQFELCKLSMNDMVRIEKTFVRVLTAFYHTRIKYPEESHLMQLQLIDYDEGARDAEAGGRIAAADGMAQGGAEAETGAGTGAIAGAGAIAIAGAELPGMPPGMPPEMPPGMPQQPATGASTPETAPPAQQDKAVARKSVLDRIKAAAANK